MATSATSSKYLDQYAIIPGAVPRIEGQWDHALVVPCFDESPEFIDRYTQALTKTSLLLILVLNRPLTANETCNDRVRDHLKRFYETQLGPGYDLFEVSPTVSLLLVDLETLEGPTLVKQGVGRARRVGCDLALHLITQGQVNSKWICSGDADACWSDALFEQAWPSSASAVTLPFTHLSSDDQQLSEATLLYELRLHHYVIQLIAMNSPYAFQTLGSACAFNAEVYAAVRGMPLRSAAEDFYILNKLAKVAPVHRATGPMVTIDARMSSRVPFGTGPFVEAIINSDELRKHPMFYDARCFNAVEFVIRTITLSIDKPESTLRVSLSKELGSVLSEKVMNQLSQWNLSRVWSHLRGFEAGGKRRRLHLETWFDGFKILKLSHVIRDHCYPALSFQETQALGQWGISSHLEPEDLLDDIHKRFGWYLFSGQ